METKQTTLGRIKAYPMISCLEGPCRMAELCKELVQRILPELDIDYVEYPELQKAINHQKLLIAKKLEYAVEKRRRIENGA